MNHDQKPRKVEKGERIQEIFLKAQTEDLSEEEMTILLEWINEHPELIKRLSENPVKPHLEISSAYDQERGWDDLKKRIHSDKVHYLFPRKRYAWWIAAAALIAIVSSLAVWFNTVDIRRQTPSVKEVFNVDSVSDTKYSMLQFADGYVMLDSLKQGEAIQVAGATVTRLNKRELKITASALANETIYYVIKSGKFDSWKLLLPDGSSVYLNKASALRFPLAFRDRRVLSLKGEAYFEVSKIMRNKNVIPFAVMLPDSMKLEVLGTRFNVSAYKKSNTTTLLEGKVAVYNKLYQRAVLKPGQAVRNELGGKFEVMKADTAECLKWKEYAAYNMHSIDEIIMNLEDHFKVTFIYKVKVNVSDIYFTGGFDTAGISLDQYLKGFAGIWQDRLRFVRKKDTVFVMPGKKGFDYTE